MTRRAPQRLLRTQRNALFQGVQRARLDPRDFRMETDNSETLYDVERLVHKDSGFSFQVEPYADGYIKLHALARRARPHRDVHAQTWDDVAAYLDIWLTSLKAEVSEPDLWDALLGQAAMPMAGLDDHDRFTSEEIEDITVAVGAAKAYIGQLGLGEEQAHEIHQRLDSLTEKATLLSRFDWRTFAAGIVVDIGMNVLFNPEQARNLFSILVQPLIQRLTGLG